MSIEKELEFNVLNKISQLYNVKSDATELLNVDEIFYSLDPTNQRHLCTSYCYNYPDYHFCSFCDKELQDPKHQQNISSNKEPLYTKQFKTLLGSDPYTDSKIYNNNDLTPYQNTSPQSYKIINRNGKSYKIYAPYIVIRGE